MIKPKKLVEYFHAACTDILGRGTIDSRGEVALRLGQRQGYEAFIQYLDRSDLKDTEKLQGFFTMSVGLGKTGFFGALIDRIYQYSLNEGKHLRVGIIEPTINLLNQTRKDFRKFFPVLSDQIGIYGDGLHEVNKPITNMAFPSWEARVDRGELSRKTVDILITDEGHRGTSVARENRLLDHFKGIARYAFTATAHFDEEKTVYNTHKREIFEKNIVRSVRDGESAAYIRAQHHVIRIVPTPGEKFNARRAKQQAFNEFVKTLLLTGVDKTTGERFGFDEVTGERLTENQIGVYTGDTAQADQCARDLNNDSDFRKIASRHGCEDFAVAVHTNGIGRGQQRKLKEAYEAGRRWCLVGDELFKEGYDHPPMKVVVVMQTTSRVVLGQIIGRGARKWWNEKKGRYEGQTAISTTIYVGCDPLDPKNPAEVERARKADEDARRKALNASVSAVDILEGDIEVFGPSVTRRAEEPSISRPRTRKSFTKIQFEFYSSLENMKTIHAEYEQVRERGRRQALLRKDETIIDWSKPLNRAAFEALWAKKGKPGSKALFPLLPKETKEADSDNKILFPALHTIDDIIYGSAREVIERRIQILTQVLEKMDNVLDWTNKKNRKEFEALLAKKGRLAGKKLFPLLPKELKAKDANGEVLFESADAVTNILKARTENVKERQIQALTKIIEQLDNKVDWTKPKNRFAFEKLWIRKGKPNIQVVFRTLPKEAKRKDLNGFVLFASPLTIKQIAHAKTKQVSERQIQILTQALESMEDMVNWTDLKIRQSFEKLRARKGNIGADALFNALPLAYTKKMDANGKVLFTSSAFHAHFYGYNQQIEKRKFQIIMQALEKLPDASNEEIKSKAKASAKVTLKPSDKKARKSMPHTVSAKSLHKGRHAPPSRKAPSRKEHHYMQHGQLSLGTLSPTL